MYRRTNDFTLSMLVAGLKGSIAKPDGSMLNARYYTCQKELVHRLVSQQVCHPSRRFLVAFIILAYCGSTKSLEKSTSINSFLSF